MFAILQYRFLPTLCLLAVALQLNAQSIDTVRYTKTFSNTPIAEALECLQTDLGVTFYFDNSWIQSGLVINARFNRHQFQDVMHKILSQTELTYVAVGNSIVLMPAVEVVQVLGNSAELGSGIDDNYNTVVIGDPSQMGKFKIANIEGSVTDGANGDPLVGATLKVEGTDKYAVTGYTGNYKLLIAPGVYDVTANCMGYEPKTLKMKVISNGQMNIELFETTHLLDEMVVTSNRIENNVRSNQMSVVEMDARSIKQLPLMTGEKDIIKSFTMMPGVKSVGEFGSGINVRGGGEDQNLYLLEKAPVLSTSHALGLMSVVNPDAVTGVTLYKGHIPAEYGDRVSSVMDIRLHDPSLDKFRLQGGIGIYSSRLQVKTPLFNKKVNLQLGGRTSYSDYLLKHMPDYYLSHSSISFYDLNGLIDIKIKNNPITLSGYYSDDYFKYSDMFAYNYGNLLGSLSWSHLFNADWSTNLTMSYSRYQNRNRYFSEARSTHRISAHTRYMSAKFNVSYSGLERNSLMAGMQLSHYLLNPGKVVPYNSDDNLPSLVEPFNSNDERAIDAAVFVNDVLELTQQLSVQIGLRGSVYSYMGARTVYNYADNAARSLYSITDSTLYGSGDVVKRYTAIEPRLSLKYMIDNESSVKISYNRNMQNINLLSNSSISTPEDIWKLADSYIKPLKVNQLAAGYYRNFLGNMLETSVEVYYKTSAHSLEFREGVAVAPSDHFETDIVDVNGKNYGIELLIKKSMGVFTGSLSYTYSRSFHKSHGAFAADKINNNKQFASSYDKPHDLSLSVGYALNKRVRFGANWAFSSGRPYTCPEYTYQFANQQVVYYSNRNKYRMEPYHRLDLSMSIDENLRIKRSWKGSWTFSVLNVYARKNAYSVTYRRDVPSEENNYNMFSLYKIYLIGVPFPTITYNFTF